MADSLVALRDRREQVIARLSEGYAADVFDVDELERRQSTDALHYAHELHDRGGDTLGIVHRDVTPTTCS